MPDPSPLSTALALLDDVSQRAVKLRNNLRDGLAADGKSLDLESTTVPATEDREARRAITGE